MLSKFSKIHPSTSVSSSFYFVIIVFTVMFSRHIQAFVSMKLITGRKTCYILPSAWTHVSTRIVTSLNCGDFLIEGLENKEL